MPPVPWMSLLKSTPLWALLVGHTTFNWGFYVLFTCLPKYLKEVLGFDMKHNAVFSALPYLIMWISINFATQIGDHLISTGKCTKVAVRKTMQDSVQKSSLKSYNSRKNTPLFGLTPKQVVIVNEKRSLGHKLLEHRCSNV